MSRLFSQFQFRLFGVCNRIGEYLGIGSRHIRLFFIYASFLTFGSPVFIYLCLAFIREVRRYVRETTRRVFDL